MKTRMRRKSVRFPSAGIYLEEDSDYTGADIQRALKGVDDPTAPYCRDSVYPPKARYTPEFGAFRLAFTRTRTLLADPEVSGPSGSSAGVAYLLPGEKPTDLTVYSKIPGASTSQFPGTTGVMQRTWRMH